MVTDLHPNQQIAWLKEVMYTQFVTISHALDGHRLAWLKEMMCTKLITISHAINGQRVGFQSAACLAHESNAYSTSHYKACS